MEKFYFPSEDYYSFKNGVDIDTPQINRWIEECINKLGSNFQSNRDINHTFCTISSGNTKVIAEGYKQANGKYTVFITVTKDYSKLAQCDVEL